MFKIFTKNCKNCEILRERDQTTIAHLNDKIDTLQKKLDTVERDYIHYKQIALNFKKNFN